MPSTTSRLITTQSEAVRSRVPRRWRIRLRGTGRDGSIRILRSCDLEDSFLRRLLMFPRYQQLIEDIVRLNGTKACRDTLPQRPTESFAHAHAIVRIRAVHAWWAFGVATPSRAHIVR